MLLRIVHVDRYVTPLREGGSLPAIVEGDDLGSYVLKFRAAGQGARALVAELICAGLAQALGLPLPEPVLLELDPALARTEPDPEIQALLRDSGGLNFGLDYLPGAITYDPAADAVDPVLASSIVWMDALLCNVDRTARNSNLLVWHGRLHLIDHGAALYFHHGWDGALDSAARPFAAIRQHVLLPRATALAEVDAALAARWPVEVLQAVVAAIPEDWLLAGDPWADAATQRVAYVAWLQARVQQRPGVLQGVIDARG